jgi:hypothetical protein
MKRDAPYVEAASLMFASACRATPFGTAMRRHASCRNEMSDVNLLLGEEVRTYAYFTVLSLV